MSRAHLSAFYIKILPLRMNRAYLSLKPAVRILNVQANGRQISACAFLVPALNG